MDLFKLFNLTQSFHLADLMILKKFKFRFKINYIIVKHANRLRRNTKTIGMTA